MLSSFFLLKCLFSLPFLWNLSFLCSFLLKSLHSIEISLFFWYPIESCVFSLLVYLSFYFLRLFYWNLYFLLVFYSNVTFPLNFWRKCLLFSFYWNVYIPFSFLLKCVLCPFFLLKFCFLFLTPYLLFNSMASFCFLATTCVLKSLLSLYLLLKSLLSPYFSFEISTFLFFFGNLYSLCICLLNFLLSLNFSINLKSLLAFHFPLETICSTSDRNIKFRSSHNTVLYIS